MKLYLQSVFFHNSLMFYTPVTLKQQIELPEMRHQTQNHDPERQPNPHVPQYVNGH